MNAITEDRFSTRRGVIRSGDIDLPIPIPPSIWGWMFVDELRWLYAAGMFTREAVVPGEILEVGSYEGLSTAALAQAGNVTCVDTWMGSPEMQIVGDPFEAFEANMRAMGLTDHISCFRGDSREVLPRLRSEGRRYRLILIDGDHSYEVAKADLLDAWAMLSVGGILVADDMRGFDGVEKACAEIGGFQFVVEGKIGVRRKLPGER